MARFRVSINNVLRVTGDAHPTSYCLFEIDLESSGHLEALIEVVRRAQSQEILPFTGGDHFPGLKLDLDNAGKLTVEVETLTR